MKVLTMGASGLDFTTPAESCASGSFAINATCTVSVTFTPTAPGTRKGAVVLNTGDSGVAATAYLTANGLAPQVAFRPGAVNFITEVNFPVSLDSLAQQVAVDGAGNVYIADQVDKGVLKETLVGGAYVESTIASEHLVDSLAVDGAGNVYIAKSDTSSPTGAPDGEELLKETFSGGVYLEVPIKTGLIAPLGVAVDGAGNIYVADTYTNAIRKETLFGGAYTETTIPTGIYNPRYLAVDGAGSLYISAKSNSSGGFALLKETFAAGVYVESTIFAEPDLQQSILGVAVDGTGVVYAATKPGGLLAFKPAGDTYIEADPASPPAPSGVAVDGAGSLYIIGNHGSVVKDTGANAPPLYFPNTFVGAASIPQSVTVANSGNQPLIFTLSYPSNGTGNFQLQSDSESACAFNSSASSATVLPGQSCTLSYVFAPTKPGLVSASVTFTSNNLQAANATQSIVLSGSAVQASQTIAFPPPAAPFLSGQSVRLGATASSGLPVAYSVVSGPAILSGSTLVSPESAPWWSSPPSRAAPAICPRPRSVGPFKWSRSRPEVSPLTLPGGSRSFGPGRNPSIHGKPTAVTHRPVWNSTVIRFLPHK